MRVFSSSLVALVTLGIPRAAAGQSTLPPLPPPSAEPPPTPVPARPAPPQPVSPAPAPPSGQAPPPPPYTPAPYAPPPPQYTYVAPPPGPPSMSLARPETHAPRFSMWTGARLGALAYMGGLYVINSYSVETVGNFVSPGLALELDLGARLARRYIVYVPFELGLVGAGHRFAGTSTGASTSFVGLGLRLLSGDVDSASFASDISLGFRTFQVSNASGTWSATGFEFLRLGLGAEIRLSTLFTLSPTVTLSGGSVTDTSGNIAFAPNQGDGLPGPLFHDNGSIASSQTTYYSFVIGCGAHLDLFGK